MLSIGLMSGTSMDGIDAALLETDGKQAIQEKGHVSIKYESKFKDLLKAAEYAVRQYEGNIEKAKNHFTEALRSYLKNELKIQEINMSIKLKEYSGYIHNDEETPVRFDDVIQKSTDLHAEAVKKLLKEKNYQPEQIDVIGYHGQTLFHRPSAKITIQVGDGKSLADQTGIFVINDFRSRDVSMGGQGAPFAPLYHQALAIRDNMCPLAVVNCGGIANITYITGNRDTDVIGFDTGPGNGLVDRYIRSRTNGREEMDTDGKYGLLGKANEEVIKLLFEKCVIKEGENYLLQAPPKSLDISNLHLIDELNSLTLEDACATLEAFTARAIIDSLKFISFPPKHWILAGGGWNNPVILRELKNGLNSHINEVNVKIADVVKGWNSTAMEAQIFAYLAVRSLKNMPISVPATTRVPEPLSGGHGYLPSKGITNPEVKELIAQNPDILQGYNTYNIRFTANT